MKEVLSYILFLIPHMYSSYYERQLKNEITKRINEEVPGMTCFPSLTNLLWTNGDWTWD